MTFIFCSSISFFDWLQNHLLTCPFKALTGIDCPGCGFQRSLIALCKGDFETSWMLYPPTIPLIFLFLTAGILYKFPVKHQSLVLKTLMLIVGNFVMISYIYKMFIQ
ncbi:DUF2752 domain-containing protein [Pedobacter sp. MR22-3]|uniref:DUF2752 domain-containing protein n=1 Tax=Pedobacter TaxID=84567 RepID=UPI002246DFBF|nr:DUF2752 domain-containing protein [Pedobacter sp. MR22-3]MCX2582254.1 DUF2752 domain-containing protein [Pedobacter sp. MR22-3]